MDNKQKNSNYPKPLEESIERVINPFQNFIYNQTTGSFLLLFCTILALCIANSQFADDYETLIKTPVGIIFDEWSFKMSLRHWVNDGLMALFFFMLGLEIKREILVGELKKPQQFFPIVAAAIGGMLVPAAIFFAFNAGSMNAHGWGIPMATDAAFAVGVLVFLGRRIPAALIVFLTALAIIDDMGAILIIAFFYSETINTFYLSIAAMLLLFLAGCNIFGFRHPVVYFLGGGMIWLTMLNSGIHATVAGILVAITVPARPIRA
ncbi:MAG: Na+/H+ antiporter NhaA, partial [Gammaproteobacteria bacterium]|nr:Na+/H+ antiporter NhaA [Gammaproteobacteria bacterium]